MSKLLLQKTMMVLLFLFGTNYAYSQSGVTGKVTDAADGSPLPGVNVIIKGTQTGTVTDLDGNFTLVVKPEDILVLSMIGYVADEVAVNGQTTLNIVLSPDITELDEIVVVGYGSQKKSDLTGSVSVVDVGEMQKTSNSNIGTLLQGRVAGVQVTSDGQPGADPVVRIRGIGTTNGTDPLYVIDGVPLGGSPRDLSPNDIESVQVLKDASAAAIYGSRAGNGVIIITTKKGRKNTPLNVSYNGFLGTDNIYQRMPVLKRVDYQNTYNMSLTNNNLAIRPGNDPGSDQYIDDVDTDWQEEGLQTGKRQNHTVTMSGGGETGTYAVVMDYFDSEGTFVGIGPDYTRYSVRANTTMEKKFFESSLSMVYTHTNQNSLNRINHSNFSGGAAPIINILSTLMPTMKVYDDTRENGFGSYDPDIHGEDYMLNIIGVNKTITEQVDVDRTLASGYGMLKLGKLFGLGGHDLDLKVNLAYDKTGAHDFLWIPAFSFSGFYTSVNATLNENWREYTTGLIENTLNYKGSINRLKIDLLAGQMFQSTSHQRIDGYGEGFPEPYYPQLGNATTRTSNSYEEASYLLSYLGRTLLDFDDRYLLTATIRRDATSRVSKDFRVGYFPSFSLGWKIHNESFFQMDRNVISELKLRGGWGILGMENIGPYETIPVLNRNVVYNFNGQMVLGSTEADFFPQKLLWESKETTNIGVDLGFLGGKLTSTIEYFNYISRDILHNVSIPLISGSIDTQLRDNAASIRNRGMEFQVGYKDYGNEFKYDISVNASILKNKVLSLGKDNEPVPGAAAQTIVDYELARHYGYIYDGIFLTQEEIDSSAFQNASTRPGDIKFKDLDTNGVIDVDDRDYLGSAIPDLTFGFNFACEYKGFDFSVFLKGATGYLLVDRNYRQLMHTGGGINWHEDILGAWTAENTGTDIPRVVYRDPNGNDRDSDRPNWLQSGNHVRISNITLGYSLPQSTLKSSFTKVRVYVTLQNLYTFTKYKGFNPDFANPVVWSLGYNDGSYPVPRSFMAGLNFDF